MEASQSNLYLGAVSLSQDTEDFVAASDSSECKKAISAIQKEYNLYWRHIDRYCKTLHKHGWDLQKALEELHICSQKWKKKDDFTSGQIKEILMRIKHDLELIYVPKMVGTDITKDPLFSSQNTMKNLYCKRTRMKYLSELDIEQNKGKEKLDTADVKRSKVVKSKAPDMENEVKILGVKKDPEMDALRQNLHMETVSTSQVSMSIQPNSQKEKVIQDPAAASNALQCEKAIAAIQKEYNLYRRHIDRYCKTLHKHGWNLQNALEELAECSQKWNNNRDFTSGRINEILEKIKHDLELIYLPKLVSTDIKLKDIEQSTTNESLFTSQSTMNNLHESLFTSQSTMNNLHESLFTSQTTMNNLNGKMTPMKNLSKSGMEPSRGKAKVDRKVKSKMINSDVPDMENRLKILEVRKVLYQFHLYNLSHLLSVASSGGILFKSLTQDLIIQTVKMMSEREKLSFLKNPSSVATQMSRPPPTTEQRLSALLCNEVSTMASSLQSMFDSYSFASDFVHSNNPDAFTISWTRSTITSEVARLDLELKWMYFDKVLQAIHNKIHVDPVSIQTASEVDLIVDSKLLHGNFDFSDNGAVLSFIGALKRYVQMVRTSCAGSRKRQINEIWRTKMCELETHMAQLELDASEIHKKVANMSKVGVQAEIRASSTKHCLERAIGLQKHISEFQSRLSMYVKHLLLDLERAQKESSEMRVQHRHAAQLAEDALVQLRKKAELHKNKLCAQLVDLKQNAEEVLEIQEKELNDLVFAILSTKVEECDNSGLESDAAASSGSLSILVC